MSDDMRNSSQPKPLINRIIYLRPCAQDGDRITYVLPGEETSRTLWKGLGNRSGLHGFQFELLRQKWEKSGGNFLKKLLTLPSGTVITVHTFRNVNRDRGNWVVVKRYVVTSE